LEKSVRGDVQESMEGGYVDLQIRVRNGSGKMTEDARNAFVRDRRTEVNRTTGWATCSGIEEREKKPMEKGKKISMRDQTGWLDFNDK